MKVHALPQKKISGAPGPTPSTLVRHILHAPRPQDRLAVGVPEGFESRFAALQGSGQPLPDSERAFFEPRFGRDLSSVRLHSGPAAGELARSVHARAFTLGDSIVLGTGEGGQGGRQLLAHELTHVVQQTGERSAPEPHVIQREDTFPLSKTDPTRGFRGEDLARLAASGGQLTFSGSLSPLTGDAQKLLLANVAETIRFALDPNHPARIAEIAALRAHLEKEGEKGPFFETPAERLDATDLYHGHVCVPASVLASSAQLGKIREAAAPYHGITRGPSIDEDIRAALGYRMPTTRPEAQKVMAVADRHRQPFLDALAPLLRALAGVPGAGVMYHSWEWEAASHRIGGKPVPREHPIRHIFTPFSTHRPELRRKDNRDCEPMINFSFHADRRGRITLLPGSSSEMVRAFEILHDPLVPVPSAAEPAKAAPAGRRWSISAAAGADVTPDAQRLALALAGRVPLRTGELLVFNPVIGLNLLYLPASSLNESHLLAATADIGLRLQQPLSGFYFDVSAGAFGGFDIDANRKDSTRFTGGLTGAAGLGWRWQELELGAETRAFVPGADFDRSHVMIFGRAALRFP